MTTTTSFLSKGPFIFNTAQSFGKFKMQVSSVLACDIGHLPVPKFEWKFEGQAQSAFCKWVADETGFQALLKAVAARRAADNVVVWLYTPKPTKDEDEWVTIHGNHQDRHTGFNDDSVREGSSMGIKGVISAMMAKHNDAEAKLMKEYPIGSFEGFPDKRVWKNKTTGSYFELTPLQIKFLANAIAAETADVSAPPNSQHFSEDK
ncbi:hypothetical protein OG21DRAFT_1484758 [Imleria badia]|nr:hypothetical protein OG21DRAFT_1484758 [Imleria badia]